MRTVDAIDLFLQSRRAKGLSPETIRWYRGILYSFDRHCPALPDEPECIENFLIQCHAGDERRHGYYRTLRCFYRFLAKRLKLPNPIECVDPPRRSHKEPHWLTPEEIDKLLSYPQPPKIKAALLFLIDTGARLGELCNLKISNLVECPWGYIAGLNGKTGGRHVPMNYETYHALMIHLPLGYTKHRLGRKIAQAFKDAGIQGSAHSLRHTFATLWEGNELVLQKIMGHSHLSTTQGYRHLRIKALLEQHAQYSPLKMVLSSSKEMFML